MNKLNKNMLKSSLIMGFFLVMGRVVTPIWIGVTFILYLVKDIPFNWWSIGTFVVSWIFFVLSWIYMYKTAQKEINEIIPVAPKRQSRFQEKLNKALGASKNHAKNL